MWNFLFAIIKWILIILSPFLVSYVIHFLYYYFVKNMRFKQGEYKYISHGSILKRLIIELPKQMVIDRFNHEPDRFTEFRSTYNCRKTTELEKALLLLIC